MKLLNKINRNLKYLPLLVEVIYSTNKTFNDEYVTKKNFTDDGTKEFLMVQLDRNETLNENSTHYIGKDVVYEISRFSLF